MLALADPVADAEEPFDGDDDDEPVDVPVALMEPVVVAVLDRLRVDVGDDVAEGVADGDTGAGAMPRNCVFGAAVATGAPPFVYADDAMSNTYTPDAKGDVGDAVVT